MSLGIASRIFATIVPHTIEEAAEVADAIERDDKAAEDEEPRKRGAGNGSHSIPTLQRQGSVIPPSAGDEQSDGARAVTYASPTLPSR
jgi:hypothetical protein